MLPLHLLSFSLLSLDKQGLRHVNVCVGILCSIPNFCMCYVNSTQTVVA